jgi:hypothetical protein
LALDSVLLVLYSFGLLELLFLHFTGLVEVRVPVHFEADLTISEVAKDRRRHGVNVVHFLEVVYWVL